MYIYIYIYIGGTQPLKLVNNATLQRIVNAANANRSTDYVRCKRPPECTFLLHQTQKPHRCTCQFIRNKCPCLYTCHYTTNQ